MNDLRAAAQRGMDGRRTMRRPELLFITGTRADYGLWEPVLTRAMSQSSDVQPALLVCGMHLDPRFGSTIDEIRRSGVPIAEELAFTAEGDSPAEMAASLGHAVMAMAPALERVAPDWVCVVGDRGEQLAAALVAVHLGLPIAHVHGGERTLGAVDDVFRDMISRAAHLHLVANHDAAMRLERLGEEPWRIREVGAPGLDGLSRVSPPTPDERLSVDLPAHGPYLLVVLHPETTGRPDPAGSVEAVIESVERMGLPTLAIGPNADAGGRGMLTRLSATDAPRFAFRISVTRPLYLKLLAGAAALVGNSSSGIIEAPMLGVPAVNIGSRQEGRARGDNVLDVPGDVDAIGAAIRQALDPAFRSGLSKRSPYGDGTAGKRILDAILGEPIDDRLLMKRGP